MENIRKMDQQQNQQQQLWSSLDHLSYRRNCLLPNRLCWNLLKDVHFSNFFIKIILSQFKIDLERRVTFLRADLCKKKPKKVGLKILNCCTVLPKKYDTKDRQHVLLMWDTFIDWLLYRRTDWAMLAWIPDASYVQDAYVHVCEVPWQMYRTHRCFVHVASMCPCMGTAHLPPRWGA